MAWIDDRIWCHPKFTDVSDRSSWAWVKGVAYSTGFATRGLLTPGQQKTIGADARVRRELVTAGLWDEAPDGAVRIHDWDEHNSRRDARRAADRERKRTLRSTGQSAGRSAGQSAGRSNGASNGASTVAARVDGSEGSDGSERKTFLPSTALENPEEGTQHPDTGYSPEDLEILAASVLGDINE